jgi:hypothetical protein
MAQTKEGMLKVAAQKAGICVADYQLRMSFGLKKCTKCKVWLPVENFSRDNSRFDGVKAKCTACDYKRTVRDHSKKTSREMKAKGLIWCSGCKNWFTKDLIAKSGKCKNCTNTYIRNLYKTDPIYRFKRISRAHERRGNGKIPVEWQIQLMKEFNGLCAYCKERPATEWDHIIPISRGGYTVYGNIAPSCKRCNCSKSNKNLIDWTDKSEEAFLSEAIAMLLNEAPLDLVYTSPLPK